MAVVPKPGARFRSAVCATEIVIVKGGTSEVDLRCGASVVVAIDDARADGAPVAPFDAGSLMGKRYVTEGEAIEVLCTRGGTGSLSVGDVPLAVKGAKPLPSSD